MTTKPKFKITDLRTARNRVDWIRNDFSGGSLRECMSRDFAAMVSEAYAALVSMIALTPSRFSEDAATAQGALDRCAVSLYRWALARCNWEAMSQDQQDAVVMYTEIAGPYIRAEELPPETMEKLRKVVCAIFERGYMVATPATATKAQEAEELPSNCVPFRKMA